MRPSSARAKRLVRSGTKSGKLALDSNSVEILSTLLRTVTADSAGNSRAKSCSTFARCRLVSRFACTPPPGSRPSVALPYSDGRCRTEFRAARSAGGWPSGNDPVTDWYTRCGTSLSGWTPARHRTDAHGRASEHYVDGMRKRIAIVAHAGRSSVLRDPVDARASIPGADHACRDCGYGIACGRQPERCPMCGGRMWRPLALRAAGSIR